ncbi:class I SAM-dependent methyltransferase [uncultured Roseivirga sp.]|uniref:class I SAM-dependent methyltransferase n=1 Tax=uncultured Roseivirga sp. TaxID=543088 RepID=UPI002587823B|nr:class I SAM-dependent methyltransferase [uncultured Roseivirga sp.]
MNYEDNPKSIKYYVKRHLIDQKEFYKGKTVVDFPAGNGVTSKILQDVGANPVPIDLFPEYFNIEGLDCIRANVREGLPLEEASADVLICQEGIEHFSDQFEALREFNKVLKPKGTLLITTPNYSNLRARMSYLLSESERYNDIMPPNEIDSIWMSDQTITDEIYFGHIFLIGAQKLRVLAKLAGFRIKKIHFTRRKSTSLLLFPFIYPFIRVSNWITYRKNLRKNKDYDMEVKREVYGEVYRLSIDPKILIQSHLMIEFEKEQEARNVAQGLKSRHKEFGVT